MGKAATKIINYHPRELVLVKWTTPRIGWVKLNTYGASKEGKRRELDVVVLFKEVRGSGLEDLQNSKAIKMDMIVSPVGRTLVRRIRRLIELDWEVEICHSYREANWCTDALANFG
ncbi:hypothetical protein L195_g007306 [Trifolium pratense]|uniref:RNase H type-1 domain-containing protein n=1 Tax=Trifolium pratense TaxID=57577 RepID=A0A2K3P605_TRIPR|nr:hypothetical protein L195_g007306 [Trifolium pratense]